MPPRNELASKLPPKLAKGGSGGTEVPKASPSISAQVPPAERPTYQPVQTNNGGGGGIYLESPRSAATAEPDMSKPPITAPPTATAAFTFSRRLMTISLGSTLRYATS